MTSSKRCRICRKGPLNDILNGGRQPLCNRYMKERSSVSPEFPLALGICDCCGAAQLLEPAPVEEVRPRFDWIQYNEPEPHLDAVVGVLQTLPGITNRSSVAGITFKEDSVLRRLQDRGFKNVRRLDPRADLGIEDPRSGLETIQDRMDAATASAIVQRNGACDIVIARHIVEHAHDFHRFLGGLKALLKPSGYLVLEVPDCQKAFEQQIYSVAWEEHIVYFTSETFRQALAEAGLSLRRFKSYPYALENSLVAILQVQTDASVSSLPASVLKTEKERWRTFSRGFDSKRKSLIDFLSNWRKKKGPIALLGAGHQSSMFINLMGLKPFFECVIDDNPSKQNLFMPGSCLPILGPSALRGIGIKLCVLSVNPDTEQKVVEKNKFFADMGGQFASIFPDSIYAIPCRQATRIQ